MKHVKKILCAAIMAMMLISVVIISASADSSTIAQGAGKVITTVLNVRSDPSTTGRVIASLKEGDIVVVEEQAGQWYLISCNGVEGYVAARYISPVESAENFIACGKITANGVNYRSGPGTDYDILGSLNSGKTVRILGINNGWYKILVNNRTGYIRSDYVRLVNSFEVGYRSPGNPKAETAVQKVVDFALGYVGYDYVYGGCSPETGFDCSGFVYYCFNTCGYNVTRTVSTQYYNDGSFVDSEELIPGDLVFFAEYGELQHVGIYIGDGQFVHAANYGKGVVVSNLDDAWYCDTWFASKRVID